MSLSLQRLWGIPRRMARTLITANQYHSRMYLTAEVTTNTPSENDPIDGKEDDIDINNNPDSILNESTNVQQDYGHYISQKPDTEKGRKMKIYMPARSAGTQGVSKVGMWKCEPTNAGKRWGNPLMGWTSTRDPMQGINHGLDRFQSKEQAITWCETNGKSLKIYIYHLSFIIYHIVAISQIF